MQSPKSVDDTYDLNNFHGLMCASLWLGAAVFFSVAVAPAAFEFCVHLHFRTQVKWPDR